MYQQLLACLHPHQSLTDIQTGRIIDVLKAIPHFYNLLSSNGVEYLIIIIPILQPYLLRTGQIFITDNTSQYILLEGDLSEEQEQYSSSRMVQHHHLIDLREYISSRLVAMTTCKFLKIDKGVTGGALVQRKLMERERECIKVGGRLKKLIKSGEKRRKRELLSKVQFFACLGEYDFLELIVESQLIEYSQGGVTHRQGGEVEKIGCILNGKVRVRWEGGRKEKGISVDLGQGEFIGLEEYLWGTNLSSSGETCFISTLIIWVPLEIFSNKFSLKTNYRTISKLMSLIQAKKLLLDRSFDTRRKRDLELYNQGETLNKLNSTLATKITAMTSHLKRRTQHNFHKPKTGRDWDLPQNLIHKGSDTDPSALIFLPKILERVNLFPEEYAKTAVTLVQRRQLQRLEHRTAKCKNQHSSFGVWDNPETIYKNILSTIPHYEPNCTQRSTRTGRQSRERSHSNESICNNFRIGKSQPHCRTPSTKLTIS